MSHKVYGPFGNPRVLKVLVVAEFAGVQVTQEVLSWEQIRAKEFTAKQPLNKVPVLETPEGFLYESNAIVRYLARKSQNGALYGANDYQRSQVDQFLDFLALEVEPAQYALLLPILGFVESNQDRSKKAYADLSSGLRVFDNALKGKQFLVGNTLTVADIVVAQSLLLAFRYYLDDKLRKQFQNLLKWQANITNLDQFKKIFGRPVLAKACLPAVGGSTYPVEEKKVVQQQPKQEQPKKQEQKPKKKDDDDDEEEVQEKKAKNPLDALPASSFVLYDFKTLYVNEPNKQTALAEFWKQFDPTGYSIWYVTYDKYEGEGEKVYLTINLMNGFLQRLDSFRKYCFGVMGVYGEEPSLEIRGVFVWRSTGQPFEITDHPQYEYHKFRKLDRDVEADRQLLEEYWVNLQEGGKVEGLTVQEAKYFK